jgi:N-acetyltransferase 10
MGSEEDEEEVGEEEAEAAAKRRSKEDTKTKSNGHKHQQHDALHEEVLQPKAMTDLPPLFLKLEERPAEKLHYMGVSYGLTDELLRFWQKLGFVGMYLRQTASDVTGEHTCIMLKPLHSDDVQNKV